MNFFTIVELNLFNVSSSSHCKEKFTDLITSVGVSEPCKQVFHDFPVQIELRV